MSDVRVVRPSVKFVVVSYLVVILILAGAAYGVYEYSHQLFNPWHLLALLLLLIPIKKHVATRLVSLTVDTDHVTLESGMLSRSRRTVDLSKIQDVTVKQTLGERMLGMGDLTLESAGERNSMMILRAIDHPRQTADLILARSRELHRIRGNAPL
jgi:uncharacterized membrane protein YdbT with pleckstrin-like domain